MVIVLDIGNTRIKWAQLVDGQLGERGHAAHRGALEQAIAQLGAALPAGVERALVANVAGPDIGERIASLFDERYGIRAELVVSSAERFGVRNGYAQPSRLGVDRWVAVLAAHRAARSLACVISAGTAVTFDAVDATGQHLGGLILAGPQLLAAALERNTSNIGSTPVATARPSGLELLGKTTAAAVGRGALLALGAALDRAVATVEKEIGARATVYLTGGNAVTLSAWLETEVELRADLVLEGLALFAAEPAGSQRPRKD